VNFHKPLRPGVFVPATKEEVARLHFKIMNDKLTPKDLARIKELEDEEFRRKYLKRRR
jgi:hypothetical protein